jgi:hypothetical protein
MLIETLPSDLNLNHKFKLEFEKRS